MKMKFLCLHGALGNADNFQTQLGPFIMETQTSGQISYKWTSGRYNAEPPDGFDDYFGKKPLRRFFSFDITEALDTGGTIDVCLKNSRGNIIKDEGLQQLQAHHHQYSINAVGDTIRYIMDIVRKDPEIQGILGFAEGASAAASVILEERRLQEEDSIPRQLQVAIFFAGFPPLHLNGNDVCQRDYAIDIPTLHVFGCHDPYVHCAMSLYAACDERSATLFDHGGGHFIPRNARTIAELSIAVHALLAKCRTIVGSTR